MSRISPIICAEHLDQIGFHDPEAAAHEINVLLAYLFLPVDRSLLDDTAVPEKAHLGPAEQSAVLGDAAEARNPLQFLRPFPVPQIILAIKIGFWWPEDSDDLGVPAHLEDGAWFSLSEARQQELRQWLRQISASLLNRVQRGTRVRSELDVFLKSLAVTYELGTDRSKLGLELGSISHSKSRFLRLAEMVLASLPSLPSGRPRIPVSQRTAEVLAARWRRIRKAVARDRTSEVL
ncbi:hypothetical protein [Rubellimicrobium aerolatum]|uniref:Uncharacterized protein n=1 Tax=Rubellimicrobium aerolatum TaxID=490979 RepID=A0ABW0SGQ7_9RHOB|nr:hypothetical protein [Rubellimicrobium aerolatum]MBP1807660.1 hypothetical protein [Rubellimicrobium aerolatum]